MEYNATVYDGRENSVAAVHQAKLSTSLSSANVTASIAPDLSTLSRNGLIAAANEAMRVQRSLEREVAALQQTMLSMQNQSQINNSAISGYQEGAFVVGKSLVEEEGSLHHLSYHGSICCQRSIQDAKVVLSAEDVSNYDICFANSIIPI
jgi:predicted esterase